MKNLLILVCFISIASCRYKTGSGNIITEKRQTGSFTAVKASNAMEVEIRTGSPAEVVVEADDNVIKDIITEVDGNTLRIGLRNNTSIQNGHLKAFVTAPGINKVYSSSAASVTVNGSLSYDGKLVFEASSASKITATLDAPEIEAESSSGSTLSLTGHTQTLKVEASSGSTVKASGLLSENTRVSASSGSSVKVHASVKLDASASSGANIGYTGGAAVSRNESSGGIVEKLP
jgi:hypothetical protein